MVSLPEADGYVSPDLSIEKSPELLQLVGDLTVPKADIFLRSLPSSARTAHEDVVVIQEEIEQAEKSPRTPIKLDVSVTLGGEIHFVGFGQDAFFDGGLRVLANPGEALSVAGAVGIARNQPGNRRGGIFYEIPVTQKGTRSGQYDLEKQCGGYFLYP